MTKLLQKNPKEVILSPNLDFSGSFEVILSLNLDFSGSFGVILSPNLDFSGSFEYILSPMDAKTEKTNDEDDDEITSNKDLIKAKFESKDTGNLWGVTKPIEKSATSKLSPKETEKSISGDKVVHKEVEKLVTLIPTCLSISS
jgi:hypothetical protein